MREIYQRMIYSQIRLYRLANYCEIITTQILLCINHDTREYFFPPNWLIIDLSWHMAKVIGLGIVAKLMGRSISLHEKAWISTKMISIQKGPTKHKPHSGLVLNRRQAIT